ncbi:MAG: Hsp33 family molecular chaperone HslO [Oligoflexia bacterium]|nr:Hsp33 family molecular chaperone HslO [Oligoflexia bacterium]
MENSHPAGQSFPGIGFTSSRWVKCISAQGNVRGVAIQATELIQSMADTHQIRSDSGMRSLGEAVMGALLIASYCKNKERVNLNIQGSGNISQALVDAYPDGVARGYVIERAEPVKGENEGPWGDGYLSVLRTKDGQAEPYIGTVPLITGHLAKDLTFYWLHSEQVPSSVGLAVSIERGKIKAAGGFLVQAMPGASSEELKAMEQHINEIHSVAEEVARNGDPMTLLSQIFQDTTFLVVEERALEFRCNCSWDRVNRALALVGVAELRAMLQEDSAASVQCDFCGKKYEVDAEGLEKLIQARGEPAT